MVFAGRKLATTQSFVWSVVGESTKYSGISGKLKSNGDFHSRRCLEGENGLSQSVLLKEVVIEPKVKLDCVPKFCYLATRLGREEGWRKQQGSEMCLGKVQ